MGRPVAAVLFGGQSSEHEISCISVQTVAGNIDREKYEVMLIGITRDGRWLLVDSLEQIIDGSWTEGDTSAVISPDASMHGVILTNGRGTTVRRVDVIFPVLHGRFGEDGTIQGLFELARIPYVGCGVLASAVGMDKTYTKKIVDGLGIAQAAYVVLLREDLADLDYAAGLAESRLSYPMFVKPSSSGSSKGVSKAETRGELKAALVTAAAEDRKILVEEMITGREIECAVFRDRETEASGVGEILAAAEFYSYEAKYNNSESLTLTTPTFPEGKEDEVRQAAIKIFDAIDGKGLARVDFFLENGTNRVVFNEINTLPGFTAISMYPMLWAEKGRDIRQLVGDLLASASLM